MSTQSVRVDDMVWLMTGKHHILNEGEASEMKTVSMPGFIFKDGKARKCNLEVSSAGRAHLDRLAREIRKAYGPLIDKVLANNPEEEPKEETNIAEAEATTSEESAEEGTTEAETETAPAPTATSNFGFGGF